MTVEEGRVFEQIRWPGFEGEIFREENCCGADFLIPRRTLSSAVWGGGLTRVRRVVNLGVAPHPEGSSSPAGRQWESPEDTLKDFSRARGWKGPSAGMMTSADMGSFRFALREEGWGGVFCFLTAGLSNARAPGDEGGFPPETAGKSLPTGTINIVAGTSVRLSDAALAEALMVITEAKASGLADHRISSPLSGRPASGTGTDSALIVSGEGPRAAFCGKHTRVGQYLGEVVIEALSSSLAYLLTLPHFDSRLCRGREG